MTEITDVGRTASIYTLSDPRDNAVRYVGVTIGPLRARLLRHLRYKGVDHRTAWVQSLLTAGVTPVITEIDIVPIETRGDAEQSWIAHYRALGADLTNSTRGGLGSPGFKHSEDARARMSATRKGRNLRGPRGPISEETREKLRAKALSQMSDPAARAAVSRVHKGKTISAESRAIVSAANTKRWAEWRASGQVVSDETRAKISRAATGRKLPPQSAELRARRSEAKRQWWANRRGITGQMTLPFG